MVAVTAQPVRAQSSVRAGGNLDGGTPSLERVAQGGASLRRGMSGPSVEEGQQLLKDAGYNVAVDGHLGPQSDRALRQVPAVLFSEVIGDALAFAATGPGFVADWQRRVQP